MTAPLSYPMFLYGLLTTLFFGTFLSELKFAPKNSILLGGFYLAAIAFQKWFFDTRHMSDRKTKSEATNQILFAGEPLETEAEAAREKRTLERVLKLPVQLRLRLGVIAMLGAYAVMVINHTLTMHFVLLFHFTTALLILPAMTPNHFILPLAVNLAAVVYTYATSDQPDIVMYSLYVLLLMFVLMAFGNVQREIKQTQQHPLALGPLTIRTAVNAVQLGVSFLLVLGIVDFFVPHPGESKQVRREVVRERVNQLQAMFGRAMNGGFKPNAEPSGGPRASGPESKDGYQAIPSPNVPNAPSAEPSLGPSGKPSAGPSGKPSSSPSARPSIGPNPEHSKDAQGPMPFPSTKPEQLQSLAEQAMKQGLFSEKDLKAAQKDLQSEIQKMLTPENIAQAQKLLKQMEEGARRSQSDKKGPGAKAKEGDGPFESTALPRMDPSGLPDKKAREKAMNAVMQAMRSALANSQGPHSGGSSGASSSGGASSGGASSGGASTGAAGGAGGSESGQSTKSKLKLRSFSDLPALIDRLLTPLLLILALVAIWYFRRKLKKKPDSKRPTRMQLAREQRAEILKRLRKLSEVRMNPREEVIARYDLFLRIMEFASTPREIYLPPTDFQRKVRYLHPPLEGQSKRITEVFCDVFYGEVHVDGAAVRGIRGAVKEVYQYFAE